MDLFNDKRFLSVIHSYERTLAKTLALLLAVVIGLATFELLLQSGVKLTQWQTDWFSGDLIKLLDRLLLIFIALEVLQNVMARHREQGPTDGRLWPDCGGPCHGLLAHPQGGTGR
jgi:uncharacterized membrane protein (DUF373 family)